MEAADESKTSTADIFQSEIASVAQIYNAIQYPLDKLFIDIRSQQEYTALHLRHAVHIPPTISDDEIHQLFKDKFFKSFVYGFANKQQIEQGVDITFYRRLQSVLADDLNETDFKLFVVNEDVATFMRQFAFLCVANDEIYWNAMVKTTPKKKAQKVNMMDMSYSRAQLYGSYPNQIIDDTLYLGTISHAMSAQILNDLQITHVLNVTCTDYDDMSVVKQRSYLQIKLNDTKQTDIASHFEAAFAFIDTAVNHKDTNRLLIHCKEGMSRSATIVIAYLMKRNKVGMQEALKFVKQRREVVDPNDGFLKQLMEFEQNNLGVKTKQH